VNKRFAREIPPQAESGYARGGFSLVRFFVPHKEMNILFQYDAVTNDKRNTANGCFSTA